MGLPRILKHQMLFHNGNNFAGEVPSVTLPKLTRKLEGYRAGGMDSAVKVDMGGGDDLDLEFTAGGFLLDVMRSYGGTLTGTLVRFVGSYQSDDSGQIDQVEVVARGRYEEIDMGEGKPGDKNEPKHKIACAYYKLVVNGVTEVEIEPLAMKLIVGGVDRLAEHRTALGI